MSSPRPGNRAPLLLLLATLAALPKATAQGQPAPPPGAAAEARRPAAGLEGAFRDITAAAGVTFQRHSAPEKKYIVESMSGGVALFDFDGDGYVDIYFVDSLTVDTADDPKKARSALYRNRGDGTFEDVSERAGVAHPGWGVGTCVADFDGDGRRDLFVTALGPDRLYRNLGGGTFEEIGEKAGVAGRGWSAGCGFADYDRDGDLDLFVSRYVEIDLAKLPEFGKGKTCQFRGIAVQCGPRGLPGTSDLLYRNEGKGRFTEVSKAAGVDDPGGYFGLGIAWFDADGDSWPDLFVANDSTANFLYLNRKNGTFQEDAFPMGVAVSEDGGEQGGMGVAVADYRNEGRLSLFVTNFAEEYNALYRGETGYFSDVSFRSASAPASLPYVGWGTTFFDYDNDGWLDLIVVNGHVYPQLSNARLGASAPYRQRKLFYRNRRDGTFEEIGEAFGKVFSEKRVSRGLALGDLDNDGLLDLVINDLDGSPQVLHNRVSGAGRWLRVRLKGPPANRDAVGARLTLRVGKLTMTRLVQSGSSYLSQNDFRPHFGLGKATRADSLTVLWPDGTTSRLDWVAADREILVEWSPPAPPSAKK